MTHTITFKEFVITGEPERNREIIDYTRNRKCRTYMDKDADDKKELTIEGRALRPGQILRIYEDDTYEIEDI